MNPFRRFLDMTRPRVETADEFLGGDPLSPPRSRPPGRARPRRGRGPALGLLVAVLAGCALALGVWLFWPRPEEPTPVLDSDTLSRYATGQGLACEPPTEDQVGLHWSCHAVDGAPRTLEWYGPTNSRATVLQASAGPGVARTDAAGYLAGVAGLGVPAGRREEAEGWVSDHLTSGQVSYGSVQLTTGGYDDPAGSYSLALDIG